MADTPNEAHEARLLARELLDLAGKLRVPKAKPDKLAKTLEEIAQRLIDAATRRDQEKNHTDD